MTAESKIEQNDAKETEELTAGTDLSVLANIIERMPGGFFIYRADENQELLYANDVMLEIFGCEDLEEFKNLTGYTFKGLVHPDDYKKVQTSIENQVASNSKEMDYVEYRIIRKDGSIRWVEDFGRFAHTKTYGDVFYVFIQDITENHMAREENIRLEKMVKGLGVGFSSVYLINLDKMSVYPYFLKNSNFKKIVAELDENDDEETHWKKILLIYAEKFILPEDKEFFLKEVTVDSVIDRLKNTESFTINYRCKGEGDAIIDVEMDVARVDEENSDYYIVMGFRDVTNNNKRT